MRKINIKDIAEESWTSPKGKFGGASKEISVALGRKPLSRDLNERHPFDIEICRIPPGKSHCPYHSHSAQWEFYHVISGKGIVRHADGTTSIEAGDAFIFGPGEAHQLSNDARSHTRAFLAGTFQFSSWARRKIRGAATYNNAEQAFLY